MDSLEINQNSCRICLEQGALVDWNDEILDSCSTTYKYCYYKYTQLEENVADTFSQLCETCSYDLKNFHFLVERALESYNILQETFAITYSQPCEIEEKFDIKEQISDDGDFETINFENSTELFEGDDDDDKKDLLELSMSVGETLEISKDIEKERINKKPKIKKVKLKEKNVIGSRRQRRDNKKTKAKKIKLKKHNDFPEDIEASIDIPEDVKETNETIPDSETMEEIKDIPQSSLLQEKPVLAKNRKLMCPYCPKLIIAQHMKKHEQTHEEHRERSESCAICNLSFFTKSSLNNHMAIHKENRVKRHKCEFCNKSYFNRGALNVHRRLHLGQLISCPICTKEFYRQVDLDKHKARTHAANIQDKNFDSNKYFVECKECGKNVVSTRWKHHSSLHLNKFQLKCTLCDKHFASKTSCHRHVRQVHKYTDEFANVVDYYGDEVNKRTSHLMLKQLESVKPILEMN